MRSELEIRGIGPATNAQWDRHWHDCAYATYFHGREWAEVWQEYTSHQLYCSAFLVRFSDGRSAVVPLMGRKGQRLGMTRAYVACAAGTYGGWISRDELGRAHAGLLFEFLVGLRQVKWRLNPFEPLALRMVGEKLTPCADGSGRWGREIDQTSGHTRALRLDAPVDTLVQQRWNRGHRSGLRRAIKADIEVRQARDLEDWRSYYEIYRRALQRWGDEASSSYRWELFELLFRRESDDVRLWIAEHEGKLIAGILCMYSPVHTSYWHGASRVDFRELRPNNLLFYRAMQHARAAGLQWFDFNPSGGHEGVEEFKRRFGARALDAPQIRAKSSLIRLAGAVERFLAQRWAQR